MTGNEQLLAPPVVNAAGVAPGVGQTGAQLMAAFPARVVGPSWPSTCDDRSAVLAVLGWLADFPGRNWQQRWQASGAEAAGDWRDLFIGESVGRWRNAPGEPAPHLSIGVMVLICADVIRPSLDWLLRFAPARRALATEMARTASWKKRVMTRSHQHLCQR